MNKKLIVFGTRPEFIKLLPVIWEIERQRVREEYFFLFTGQQDDLVRDLFGHFNFLPDYSIPFADHKNSLPASFIYLTGEIQKNIDLLTKNTTLSMIIAQGDTSSCISAAMCAYLNKIPFSHIEAGLRTNNMEHPWPEEYFRKIISMSTTLHFVPTKSAFENLIKEGIDSNNIYITGNTIVDVIHHFKNNPHHSAPSPAKKNKILISCHRRENQGKNFNALVKKICELAKENKDYEFIWLKHPNLANQSDSDFYPMYSEKNITISSPLSFPELYKVYESVKMIISDSGGIQEEAPSFNIPVIIIRRHTERKESLHLGYSETVSDIENDLYPLFNKYLQQLPSKMINPYGNGDAALTIVSKIQQKS